MAMRIPAEFGLLGAMYLVYYGWRAMRLAFEPHADAMLRYAFLYSLGAMLLSFCFIGEFLNPCIPAFIVLLAQVLRAKKAVTIPERAPTSSSAFAPESATPSPGIG